MWRKKHTRIPTLGEFFQEDFLPSTESRFRANKPKTADYYGYGVTKLLSSGLGDVKLNEITSQHADMFIARNSNLSPSTQNCALRTLRRGVNLACEWGKLERPVRITLAKGERQRDRVVSRAEFNAYRELCRQPWRDVATVLYGTAMRPGEAYKLRWSNVLLTSDPGLIQILDGKSKSARRLLPMVPEVFGTMLNRWESQGRPTDGWVFPAASRSGHFEESAAKIQHCDALKKLGAANAAYLQWEKDGSSDRWEVAVHTSAKIDLDYLSRHSEVIKAGVKPFEPYCLRHSCLTHLAEAGCDAFTLARIAGHSSMGIIQRYCHPQADTIERAFKKLRLGTNLGTALLRF
jgi:integrase